MAKTTKPAEVNEASAESKTTKPAEVNVVNPLEDKVELTMVPPSQEKEDSSEFLACNDYTAKAKYGEAIEVPRCVKAILENQQIALAEMKKNREKLKNNKN